MKKMMSSKMTKTANPTTTKSKSSTAGKTTSRTVSKTTTIRELAAVTVTAKRKPSTTSTTVKKTTSDNRMFFVGDPRKGKVRQVDINEYYRSKEKEGQGKQILRTDESGKPLEVMGGGKRFTNYIPMNKK